MSGSSGSSGPPPPWQKKASAKRPGHVFFVYPVLRSQSILYQERDGKLSAILPPSGYVKRESYRHPGFTEFWNEKTDQTLVDVLSSASGCPPAEPCQAAEKSAAAVAAVAAKDAPEAGAEPAGPADGEPPDGEPPACRRKLEEPSAAPEARAPKAAAPEKAAVPEAAAPKEAKTKGKEGRKLARGMTVEIFGLEGARELNNRHGELQDFAPDRGRWCVDVAGAGHKFVKPQNLKIISQPAKANLAKLSDGGWVEIHGLPTGHHLNGRRAKLQYESEPGRWQASIVDLGLKMIAAEHLRPVGGPKEMHNGQYFTLGGMKEEGTDVATEYAGAPLLPGIDD